MQAGVGRRPEAFGAVQCGHAGRGACVRRGGPSTGTLPSPGELPERTLLGAGPRGWAWWLRGQAWEVAFSADSRCLLWVVLGPALRSRTRDKPVAAAVTGWGPLPSSSSELRLQTTLPREPVKARPDRTRLLRSALGAGLGRRPGLGCCPSQARSGFLETQLGREATSRSPGRDAGVRSSGPSPDRPRCASGSFRLQVSSRHT